MLTRRTTRERRGGSSSGEPGPVRDAVLLNAAAALVALEPGDGPLADRLRAGIERGAESVDSGRAAASLTAWVDTSRELAESAT